MADCPLNGLKIMKRSMLLLSLLNPKFLSFVFFVIDVSIFELIMFTTI